MTSMITGIFKNTFIYAIATVPTSILIALGLAYLLNNKVYFKKTLRALQNVPTSLYEASDIDGASGWQKFWKITFPMISPTTFYLVIVRFIAVFKIFSSVNIMTMGSSSYANT